MTNWPLILRGELDHALAELDTEGLEELAGVLEVFRLRVERQLVTSTTGLAAADAPVDAEAVAAALGVKESAIYDWSRKKRIPSERFGRFVRFRLSAVRAALNPKTGELSTRKKPRSNGHNSEAPTRDLPPGARPVAR